MKQKKAIDEEYLVKKIASDVKRALHNWEDYRVYISNYKVKVYSEAGFITRACIRDVQIVADYYSQQYLEEFYVYYGVEYDDELKKAVVSVAVVASKNS